MSGAAIVRALLVAHPPVTDIAPPERVVVGVLSHGAILPAVSAHTISSRELETVARNKATKLTIERVQVTVLTKDYRTMDALIRAAALGRGVHAGEVVGFNVRSVLPVGVGPAIPPGDDGIYEQSRDFMVTFIEAN